MKFYKILIITLLLFFKNATHAQIINWGSMGVDDQHIINAKVGLEHGLIFGVGYGYHHYSKIPIVANIQFSLPSGKNLTNDFKTTAGVNVRLFKIKNIHFATNINGVFRKYQNSFVRILDFGCDLSAIVGYYKPKWFIAAEVGFDKAIINHYKHSSSYSKYFPEVQNGWFDPSAGGNFYCDLQTGISIKKHDINLKFGIIITQDFKTKPTIPFIASLGYNFKFNSQKKKS